MDKMKKKRIKRYIAWGCLVALVILLAVMPLLAAPDASEDGPQASILSTQATRTDITKKLIGGGTLSSDDMENLTIPAAVKLKEYLVNNGDVITKGDPIAVVDRVSVMTAITEIQETLDYLDSKIETASTDTVSESITAQVNGTVKTIYATVGDDVQDVMLDHGALAVLSLDGKMAVQLERNTNLTAGTTVCVTLSDETEVDGTVASNLDGVLVVTVEDEDYSVGQSVTVTTEDGDRIGSGELYIHSPWNVYGYTGTVFTVQVKEGQSVYSGQLLLRLKETGVTSEYQELLSQRQEYEQMMQKLFVMYDTQLLTAPCDGIISGVDTDGAFLLSAEAGSASIRLLGNQTRTAFMGYTARVLSVSENSMELLADPTVHEITNLSHLAAVDTEALTQHWSYTGSTHVYTQTEAGLLEAGGIAREGDTLLLAGDADAIRWIIRLEETADVKPEAFRSGFQIISLTDTNTPVNPPADETPPAAPDAEPTLPEDSEETTAPTEPEAPYQGHSAVVVSVSGNTASVLQNPVSIPMQDANSGSAPASVLGMSQSTAYTHELVASLELQPWDLILVITDNDGVVQNIVKGGNAAGGQMSGMPDMDISDLMGGMAGGFGGGAAQVPVFEPYSLEELTVATVISQEIITLDITVDEEDILLLHVGQTAQLLVSPLGGERFEAVITEISNAGTNSGGRSKFTVTASTQKHQDMYPGMTAALVISLDTVENVVAVPVEVLVEDGTRTLVYTGYDAENDVFTGPVEVTTGISDGEMVEVTGLEEGTKIWYAYYDTLEQSLTPESRKLF